MNPECDYFEKTVPEGEFCPHCGKPLNRAIYSPIDTSEPYIPLEPEPIPVSPEPYPNSPSRTVVEAPNLSLKLRHADSGETFTIARHSAMNKIYIGRQEGISSEPNFVDVSNISFAERVSRRHAYITWDSSSNSFTIADNESTNGTILNGRSLTPHQSYSLKRGDRLEFGREHKVIFTVDIKI